MTVDLPDGSVARIEYKGDVPPKVTFAPASHIAPIGFVDPFDSVPLKAFDRIAAEMDRQTMAMIHEAAALPAMPSPGEGKLELAAFRTLPPGTIHYQLVSTSNGGRTCSRSIEMTAFGPGQKPKIVSSSSGDCKPANPTPARVDSPPRMSAPGLTKTRMTATADHSRAGITA